MQLSQGTGSEGVRYEGESLTGLWLGAGRAEGLGNPKAIGRPREECERHRPRRPWLIWLIIILISSLFPGDKLPEIEFKLLHIDKLVHFVHFLRYGNQLQLLSYLPMVHYYEQRVLVHSVHELKCKGKHTTENVFLVKCMMIGIREKD